MDRTGEAVLHGREDVIGGAIANRAERGFEGATRHEDDVAAEQLQGGFFAERAAFALKGDSRLGTEVHAEAALRGCARRLPPLPVFAGSAALPRPCCT